MRNKRLQINKSIKKVENSFYYFLRWESWDTTLRSRSKVINSEKQICNLIAKVNTFGVLGLFKAEVRKLIPAKQIVRGH